MTDGMHTIALLGAGGPAGFNFIRALDADGMRVRIRAYDANPLHLKLLPETASVVVEPEVGGATTYEELGAADLVHAQPDPLVATLSARRGGVRTFLPGPKTIELCQDKFASAVVWAKSELVRAPVLVTFRGDLSAAERELHYPLWLRARRGAGARHATYAKDRDTAGMWIHYLTHRFGAEDLVAHAFLPGRDYGVTLLFFHGSLMAWYVRERLEYLYPQHAVSGRTGTPVVARILAGKSAEKAFGAAITAVAAIGIETGEASHGVMSVDLREDADGVPRPTEINAGRFFTTSHVGAMVGVNAPAIMTRLALGTHENTWFSNPVAVDSGLDGTLVVRHMDAETRAIYPADQDAAMRAFVDGLVA